MTLEQRSILVAGPDPDLLDLIASRLTPLGIRVRRAHSLFEAMAYAEREAFDLAVVDQDLPAVGDVSLVARLADAPSPVRVIVLVDPLRTTSYERAVESGAYRCLPRSRSWRELEHAVEEALESRSPLTLQTGASV
ncbi:MAG: response regulator [Pirellulales bacterium]